MKLLFLLILPALASAQPPGYYCVHYNEYYAQGVPPAGSPNECEAVSWSTAGGSFTYFFPLDQTSLADPPAQAAPEVSPQGAVGALTLLFGAIAVGIGRRRSRSSQESA